VLDTSSSNGWIKYQPGLTLSEVFRTALAIVGADRLLFGTDSSFFPRGWVSSVHQAQQAILDGLGADEAAKQAIFGGTFERLFPV
jgi:predicted TIM-barrel fold metal-dependent hydrolase